MKHYEIRVVLYEVGSDTDQESGKLPLEVIEDETLAVVVASDVESAKRLMRQAAHEGRNRINSNSMLQRGIILP